MKKTLLLLSATVILWGCNNTQESSSTGTEQTTTNDKESIIIDETIKKSIVEIGQVLVSIPQKDGDPRFQKTVVLITKVTDESIVGLILNKKTGKNLSDYMENIPKIGSEVYYGGPSSDDGLFFIQATADTSSSCSKVLENVYFMGDFQNLMGRLIEKETATTEARFYVGVSVWGIDQLEKEVNEWGSWKISNIDPIDVRNREEIDLWSKLYN